KTTTPWLSRLDDCSSCPLRLTKALMPAEKTARLCEQTCLLWRTLRCAGGRYANGFGTVVAICGGSNVFTSWQSRPYCSATGAGELSSYRAARRSFAAAGCCTLLPETDVRRLFLNQRRTVRVLTSSVAKRAIRTA